MTSKNTPKERRGALTQELEKRHLDLALISNPRHIYYFTGLSTRTNVYETLRKESRPTSFLGVGTDGSSFLFLGLSEIANPFFGGEIIASKAVFDGRVFTFGDYKIDERMMAYPNFIAEELVEVLEEMKAKNGLNLNQVAIEDWHLAEAYVSAISKAFPEAKFFGLSELILSMRKVKGGDEIRHLKNATERLDLAQGMARPYAKVGCTEIEMYRQVNSEFFREYGPFALVTGDLVSGRRTLDIIGAPTDRRFEDGDTIILDLQTSCNNYWSDIARTFVTGKPSQVQERVFRVLLRAKEKAEKLLKPGTKGKDIYDVVSEEISKAGYSKQLIHHAGHGVGLEDREPPFFIPNSEDELEDGVVCIVEPGIYESSVGGMRIADCYVITRDGFEKLSNSPLGLS